TIAVSKSSSSGTIATSAVTAATGPNHWDHADNWSTGAVPTTGDDVFIESASHRFLYGLPTTLELDLLVILRGQVGLPTRNAAGYTEYRTTRATIDCDDVQIGERPRVGPDLVMLDLDDADAVVVINGSAVRGSDWAVNLILDSA